MEELEFDITSLQLESFVGKPNKSVCKKRVMRENMETMKQFCTSVKQEFPDTVQIVFSSAEFIYFADKMSRFDLETLGIVFTIEVEKGMMRLIHG